MTSCTAGAYRAELAGQRRLLAWLAGALLLGGVIGAGLLLVLPAVVFRNVAWAPALLIAAGSVVGGLIGGRYGRRLPDPVLRGVIVAVGLTAVVRMLL